MKLRSTWNYNSKLLSKLRWLILWIMYGIFQIYIRNVQYRWCILIWLNEIIAHPNYAGLSHPGCTEKHNFDTIQSVCGAFLLFRSAFGVFTSYCLASSPFQVIQIEFYEPFVQYVSSKSNIRDLNIVYKIILYEKLFLKLFYISWI